MCRPGPLRWGGGMCRPGNLCVGGKGTCRPGLLRGEGWRADPVCPDTKSEGLLRHGSDEGPMSPMLVRDGTVSRLSQFVTWET